MLDVRARQFNLASSHADGGCSYLMCNGLLGGDGYCSAVAVPRTMLSSRGIPSKSTNSWGKVVMEKVTLRILPFSANSLFYSRNGQTNSV
jgi:hypothetical protein